MQVPSLGWEDPLKEGMATTPVFLLQESHGQRSLAGYSPHSRKDSDTTEVTEHACTQGDRVNGLLDLQCPNWKDKLITRADI